MDKLTSVSFSKRGSLIISHAKVFWSKITPPPAKKDGKAYQIVYNYTISDEDLDNGSQEHSKAVDVTSQWRSKEWMMVYFKLMTVKC